jgi:hypothetical protein
MSRSYDKSVIRAFIILIAATLCAVLCAFVFAPLEMSTVTNILYKDSPIPALCYYLRKFLEAVSMFLLFGLVAFSEYFWHGNKPCKNAFLALAGVVACLKWMLNFIASAVFSGVVNFTRELFVTLIYALLDIALIAVVYVAATIMCKKHYERAESMKKAKRRISGIEYNERAEVYPFISFLSLKNPIQFPALIGAAVYTAFLLISRMLYDVSFGAPSGASEVFSIIFGYAGDILTGALCYVLCYFSAIFLFAQNDKIE